MNPSTLWCVKTSASNMGPIANCGSRGLWNTRMHRTLFFFTCSMGSGWPLEGNEQTREQLLNWFGLWCSIKHLPDEGVVLSHLVKDGQSQSTTCSGALSVEKTPRKSHKVLEVTFMLSVSRDALLSEFLCHSHQVSGVWVSKTVRRKIKIKSTKSISLSGAQSASIGPSPFLSYHTSKECCWSY